MFGEGVMGSISVQCASGGRGRSMNSWSLGKLGGDDGGSSDDCISVGAITSSCGSMMYVFTNFEYTSSSEHDDMAYKHKWGEKDDKK